MAATLYPLLALPRPWHNVGLDYLTHLLVSNGFESVLNMVDHLARMAHFLPCAESVIAKGNCQFVFTWSLQITWTTSSVA
jgi:hypothetical protein